MSLVETLSSATQALLQSDRCEGGRWRVDTTPMTTTQVLSIGAQNGVPCYARSALGRAYPARYGEP